MFLKVSVFALLVLSAYAGSEEGNAEWKAMKEQWKAIKDKCAAENGVDIEQLKKMHENKDAEVDRSIKCFGACIMKEKGTMADDGTFDLQKAIEQVPEHVPVPEREKMIEGLTTCAENKGEDQCETAHLIFTCLHEKNLFKHKRGSSESQED